MVYLILFGLTVLTFCLNFSWPPFCSETSEETYDKIANFGPELDAVMEEVHNEMTDKERDLIYRLLSPREKRIGAVGGAKEIFSHPYFAGFDIANIRSMRAPIEPEILSETDTSNFDQVDDLEDSFGGFLSNQSYDWLLAFTCHLLFFHLSLIPIFHLFSFLLCLVPMGIQRKRIPIFHSSDSLIVTSTR